MKKEPKQEEDITLINLYASKTGTPKYIQQTICNNTIIIGDVNTPVISVDRSSRQNINTAMVNLNDTIKQLDLIDIYRTSHSKRADFTLFSSAHGIFSRIDHILGQKTSLNKFRRIEILSSILSDHNGIKLEINYRKKNGKSTNTWRHNNILLKKKEWVNEEIKEEIRKYLKTNENVKHNFPKSTKQFYKGSLQLYRSMSRNKKNLK